MSIIDNVNYFQIDSGSAGGNKSDTGGVRLEDGGSSQGDIVSEARRSSLPARSTYHRPSFRVHLLPTLITMSKYANLPDIVRVDNLGYHLRLKDISGS